MDKYESNFKNIKLKQNGLTNSLLTLMVMYNFFFFFVIVKPIGMLCIKYALQKEKKKNHLTFVFMFLKNKFKQHIHADCFPCSLLFVLCEWSYLRAHG